MKPINWYKRGDGVLFCAEEGSAMDEILKSDGSFVACDEDGNLITASSDEDDTQPNQPLLEQTEKTKVAGSSGPGQRSGARGGNKEKDAAGNKKKSAGGKNVSEKGSDSSGEPSEPSAGPSSEA